MAYFKDMVEFCGTPSSGRFAFLFSVLVSNVVVWYTWLFVCMWTRSMVDIPAGVYTALAICNGVAFIGKGIQSFAERPTANTQTQTFTQSSTKSTTKEKTEGEAEDEIRNARDQ